MTPIFDGETVAILATGPSMSQEVASSVRNLATLTVNDAYRLAPWSLVQVAADAAWWVANPDALGISALKFTLEKTPKFEGVTPIADEPLIRPGSNSGLFALWLAATMGATRVLLLGFDMRGGHYFGEHQLPLQNTAPHRFEMFKQQFAGLQPFLVEKGVEVLNCTPGSALKCFPMGRLEEFA